jgi:hypothetical protein
MSSILAEALEWAVPSSTYNLFINVLLHIRIDIPLNVHAKNKALHNFIGKRRNHNADWSIINFQNGLAALPAIIKNSTT